MTIDQRNRTADLDPVPSDTRFRMIFGAAGWLLWLMLAPSVVAQTDHPESDPAVPPMLKRLGNIGIKSLNESSGLARCSLPDMIWTINDSGNRPELFGLRTDGQWLGTYHLAHARNIDWEAMDGFELDGRRWLVIADTGDNDLRRDHYQLYFVPEPVADGKLIKRPQPLTAWRHDFRVGFDAEADAEQPEAADKVEVRPINCEAMAVDAEAGEIWMVEKVYLTTRRERPPGVFALPLPVKALRQFAQQGRPAPERDPDQPLDQLPIARQIGSFPVRNVTGMAFSADGRRLIIRNYLTADWYQRPEGQTWRETLQQTRPQKIGLPLQRQGEAICFDTQSDAVILTSEAVQQPIWRLRIPSPK